MNGPVYYLNSAIIFPFIFLFGAHNSFRKCPEKPPIDLSRAISIHLLFSLNERLPLLYIISCPIPDINGTAYTHSRISWTSLNTTQHLLNLKQFFIRTYLARYSKSAADIKLPFASVIKNCFNLTASRYSPVHKKYIVGMCVIFLWYFFIIPESTLNCHWNIYRIRFNCSFKLSKNTNTKTVHMLLSIEFI